MRDQIISNIQAADLIPHARYNEPQLILLNGKRKQGKTTLIGRYIEQREPRLFMSDPHNDFPSIPIAESVEEALEDMQNYPRACWRRVVPTFGATSNDDFFEYSENMFRMVNRYLRNSLCVYNEISLHSPPKASRDLQNQITQGRRMGIRHLIDCQRLGYIPDVMKSECTSLVVFRTTRHRDLQVLSEETTPEIAKIAQDLTTGRCVLVDM